MPLYDAWGGLREMATLQNRNSRSPVPLAEGKPVYGYESAIGHEAFTVDVPGAVSARGIRTTWRLTMTRDEADKFMRIIMLRLAT